MSQSSKAKIIFKSESQRGVAIYLASVTLSMIMGVALWVSLLSIKQLKSLNEAGAAVTAFAAAETGIEWGLVNVTVPNITPVEIILGEASCTVTSYECGAGNQFLCIRSVGEYHGRQRAIKVRL